MKRITLVPVALMMLLPVISFAQTSSKTNSQITSQELDTWVIFQEEQHDKLQNYFEQIHADRDAHSGTNASDSFIVKEHAKRVTFFKQMKADKEAFLKDHPDVKAYIDQKLAALNTRVKAKKKAIQQARVSLKLPPVPASQ